MEKLTLVLNIKPKSINNKMIPIRVGRSLRLAKSPEYRVYECYLSDQYGKFDRDLKTFFEAFNEELDAIESYWVIRVPQNEFFTKKGTINKRCIDASNAVKILEDVLVKHLGIDDSQFVDSNSKKIPVSSSSWSVSLTLVKVGYPQVIHLDD